MQFTDAERALNERVESFIFAPKFNPSHLASSAETYETVKKDLEGQTLLAASLKEKQELAFKAGQRKNLHDMSVKNDAHALEAEQYATDIARLYAEGKTDEEIKNIQFQKNPHYVLNPLIKEMHKWTDPNIEDQNDTRVRELSDLAKEYSTRSQYQKGFTSWGTYEKAADTIDFLENQKDSAHSEAEIAKIQKRIELTMRKDAFRGAMENSFVYNVNHPNWSKRQPGAAPRPFSEVTADIDEQTPGRLIKSFGRFGITIEDDQLLASHVLQVGGASAGFLEDPYSLQQLAIEELQSEGEHFDPVITPSRADIANKRAVINTKMRSLLNEINVLGDRSSAERADADPNSEEANLMRRADRLLKRGGAIFSELHEDRLEMHKQRLLDLETYKEMRKRNPTVAKEVHQGFREITRRAKSSMDAEPVIYGMHYNDLGDRDDKGNPSLIEVETEDGQLILDGKESKTKAAKERVQNSIDLVYDAGLDTLQIVHGSLNPPGEDWDNVQSLFRKKFKYTPEFVFGMDETAASYGGGTPGSHGWVTRSGHAEEVKRFIQECFDEWQKPGGRKLTRLEGPDYSGEKRNTFDYNIEMWQTGGTASGSPGSPASSPGRTSISVDDRELAHIFDEDLDAKAAAIEARKAEKEAEEEAASKAFQESRKAAAENVESAIEGYSGP